MSEINPEEIAEAASQPGTFSFVDRLLGRNYPTTSVNMYLDEQAAFDRQSLSFEAEAFKLRNKEQNLELVAKIDELDRQLNANKYVITLQGFPPEEYDALVLECEEQYPPKYEETTNPFSGEKKRTKVETEEFFQLLWSKLWAKSIVKITAPDGAVDASELEVGTAAKVRNNFPIDARRKVDLAIQELRLTSEWIDSVQDEGFLVTP